MASPSGKIWGRILDGRRVPVPGAAVRLTSPDGEAAFQAASDERGFFSFFGLPPGIYDLRAQASGIGAAESRGIFLSEASDVRVECSLSADREGTAIPLPARAFDVSAANAQTTLLASQIELMPSGLSIGSLIENQDFSATTNRIDVGGLWSDLPTLFSARGGTSWTQNAYLLNGMDVGDPYETGQPLLLPDVFSLAAVDLGNAMQPAGALGPGGRLSLTPRTGTTKFHGGIRGFYTDKSLAADNITPLLQNEGLTESSTFSRLMDLDVHLSGPLSKNGAAFFTSWSLRSLGRDLASFEAEDRSSILTGMFNLSLPLGENSLQFLWNGQALGQDAYGAGRDVPWLATSRRKNAAHILQILYQTKPGSPSFQRLGLSWASSDTKEEPQTGAAGPARVDLLTNRTLSSAPASLQDGVRNSLVLTAEGSSFLHGLGITDHRLDYGIAAHWSRSSQNLEIPGNVELRYVDGRPVEAAVYGGPFAFSASSFEASAQVQDTIGLGSFLTARLGLNADWLSAGNGSSTVRWLTFAPRMELTFHLSRRRTSALKLAAGRYAFGLPLKTMAWGNPGSPGALIYAWTDPRGDGTFSADDLGQLLRREGPAFSAIDPDLERPTMDEFVLAFIQDFGKGWRLTLSGFLRQTKNLIETVNTGVTAADYDSFSFWDAGDDRLAGTLDDLTFSLYNRKSEALGKDFFLLSNPDASNRISTYKGMDLNVVKTWDGGTLAFLSLTSMEIVGTASPGNTEWENDDGVIGLLYDDPNASFNARGRLRFDRAYTVRMGFSIPLPFRSRLGFLAKYYDGQPFTREIVVEGLRQGAVILMAHYRGKARYEYNMTVDLRLEKAFAFGGTSLRVLLDVFNALNQNLATEESALTRPEFPLRYATEIQSPRVVRLGLDFQF